jgi:hypothetical protein
VPSPRPLLRPRLTPLFAALPGLLRLTPLSTAFAYFGPGVEDSNGICAAQRSPLVARHHSCSFNNLRTLCIVRFDLNPMRSFTSALCRKNSGGTPLLSLWKLARHALTQSRGVLWRAFVPRQTESKTVPARAKGQLFCALRAFSAPPWRPSIGSASPFPICPQVAGALPQCHNSTLHTTRPARACPRRQQATCLPAERGATRLPAVAGHRSSWG